MNTRQMHYMEWTVTARRDTEDGHVYLTAHAEGRETLTAVAVHGGCGRYATSHWRVGNGGPVHRPDLRLRVMLWLEREYAEN